MPHAGQTRRQPASAAALRVPQAEQNLYCRASLVNRAAMRVRVVSVRDATQFCKTASPVAGCCCNVGSRNVFMSSPFRQTLVPARRKDGAVVVKAGRSDISVSALTDDQAEAAQ
jgi:hypothetical protein